MLIKHVNCNGPQLKFEKHCLPGAKISQLTEFFNKFSSSCEYEAVFIHCGTNSIIINDVGYVNNSDLLVRDFKLLLSVLKTKFPNSRIVISGLLFRRDLDFSSLCCINDFISNLCHLFNFTFVDPCSWLSPVCLGRDGLHLNRKGSYTFSKFISHASEELLLPKN